MAVLPISRQQFAGCQAQASDQTRSQQVTIPPIMRGRERKCISTHAHNFSMEQRKRERDRDERREREGERESLLRERDAR